MERESMRSGEPPVRIGTQVSHDRIGEFASHGFESFDVVFQASDAANVAAILDSVARRLSPTGAEISALNTYANALAEDAEGDAARALWRSLIVNAPVVGCDIVAGFSGRLMSLSVAENLPRFIEVFGPLFDLAEKHNARLAFETCPKPGKPNIAINPEMWRAMIEAIGSDRIGLQWEPAHQLRQLMNPIRQLQEWATRVFHVHGKDGTLDRDVLETEGILASKPYFVDRTASFGESDWKKIVSILVESGFSGSIDIEGFHDPEYFGDRELEGQIHALAYLKRCRDEVLAGS